MPAPLTDLLRQLMSSGELQATLLLAVVVVVGLLYLLRMQMRRWRCERTIRKIIHRLGVRRIENLRLPDGTGGEVTIEHLLLARDALIVIGIMRFDGLIFGGKLTDQWTQVLGRRSYKFDNPNHYLQRQLNAVSQLVPDIPVTGRQLFPNARFPKDKPDNILLLSDLKALPARPRIDDIPQQLQAAWKQVQSVSTT